MIQNIILFVILAATAVFSVMSAFMEKGDYLS
jgi:hypothetical protein